VITGGEILFDGVDVLSMDEQELRRIRWWDIAIVFQSAMNALNPVATLGAQIGDVIREHDKTTAEEARRRAEKLLELVGLDPVHLRSYPHQLSGGMRQRAVIAMALALEPRLIIMDEPTTALDVVVQRDIMTQLTKLQRERGFAILLVSHDLSLMMEMCTRVSVVYAGRLAESLPTSQLCERRARHPYTQGLLSSFPTLHGPSRRIDGIPGSPPDLLDPPQGCRFNPRCSVAETRCFNNEPTVRSLNPLHVVACHLAE
jgi:peptide/nickel transport system ATP-binding protein